MSSSRRSRAALEDAVDRAASARARAIALYQLALFHDNNSRESIAIPLYEKALRTGLRLDLKAQALAWLASSLYKTGRPQHALKKFVRPATSRRSARCGNFSMASNRVSSERAA